MKSTKQVSVSKNKETITCFGETFKLLPMKELKEPGKNIYVWLYYDWTTGDAVYAKVGQTYDTVYSRLDHTGSSEINFVIGTYSIDMKDTDIHELLKELGYEWAGDKENPTHSQEAFKFTADSKLKIGDLLSVLEELAEKGKMGPDFFRRFKNEKINFYKFQKDVIKQALKILKTRKRVLVHLSTRAGKSAVSLKVAAKSNAKKILILTPFPNAEKSFKEFTRFQHHLKGFHYVKVNKKTSDEELNYDKAVYFCSFQMYDDEKEIIAKLQDIDFDFVIIDECHNTSESIRSESILSGLKADKLIYLSGSPFNDIFSGRFDISETVTFDFVDFILYAKAHPDEIKLPDLHIYMLGNMFKLNNILEKIDPNIFKKGMLFSLDHVFTKDKLADGFFNYLFDGDYKQRIMSEKSLFVDASHSFFEVEDKDKVLVFAKSNKEVAVITKALKKQSKMDSMLRGAEIRAISGEDTTLDSDEESVNKFFAENGIRIIVTCRKLTTGVTLPQLNKVWLFSNVSSAETYVQILFRTMTIYPDKDKVEFYDFSTDSTINMYKQYASLRTSNGLFADKSEKVSVSETFSLLNQVINLKALSDSLTFEKFTPQDMLKAVRNIPFSKSLENAFSNFDALEGLKDLGGVELVAEKCISIYDRPSGNDVYDDLSKIEEKLPKLKKEKTADVVRQFKTLANRIYRQVFINYKDVHTYKDLMKFIPQEFVNLNIVDKFEDMLNNNKANINQFLVDLKEKMKTDDGKIQVLTDLPSIDKEKADIATPPEIVDKMLEYVSVKPRKDAKVLVPCCGRGTLMMQLVKRGFLKKNIYGFDIIPENVECCKSLGFKNVWCANALDKETWESLI